MKADFFNGFIQRRSVVRALSCRDMRFAIFVMLLFFLIYSTRLKTIGVMPSLRLSSSASATYR